MQAQTVENCDRKESELISLRHDVSSLQEANQELIHEKSLLQDRLESAISDKDRLWDTMQTSLQAERYAYQTMVNHAVQKNGGGIPYADAHSLTPSEVRKLQTPGAVGRSGRRLPSEAAMRDTQEFVSTYMQTMGVAAEQVA